MSKIGFRKRATPDTPSMGVVNLFIDTNGNLCWQDENGRIGKLAAAGSYTLTIPATGTAALKSGTQVANRVAYWSDANTLTDDAGMTYDAANNRLTVSGGVITPIVRPASDSTTALRIQNASGGAAVFTVDTTNERVGIGSENPLTPAHVLDVYGEEPDFAAKIRNMSGDTTGHGLWIDTRWNTSGNLPLKVSSNQGAAILLLVTGNGNLGVNVPSLDLSSGSIGIDVGGNVLRLRLSRTISSSSAPGNAGEICWDADYIYVCVAQNTWKRVALSSW